MVKTLSRTTDRLLASPVDSFRPIDEKLWDANVAVVSRGRAAAVNVNLRDSKGHALGRTNVTGTLFCDDFYAAPDLVLTTDDGGNATFTFDQELATCTGRRWVHVTAGPEYPLVEKVAAVP